MTHKIAIQDTYGDRFQYCWGCGPKNEEGLHLKSYPGEDGETCLCQVKPADKFTGGVPANLFGGMIAMIFDCHGTASAAWFAHKSRGLTLTEDTIIRRFITAHLGVDFLRPVPMNEVITVTARLEELTDRKAVIAMTMEAAGQPRAKAKMVAVGVKKEM